MTVSLSDFNCLVRIFNSFLHVAILFRGIIQIDSCLEHIRRGPAESRRAVSRRPSLRKRVKQRVIQIVKNPSYNLHLVHPWIVHVIKTQGMVDVRDTAIVLDKLVITKRADAQQLSLHGGQ